MLAFDATYFGDAGEPTLFGLLQRTSEARVHAESVLICYPAPQEMMRTYWTHKRLAEDLASLGIQTLRFDYSGTGDSLGATQGLDIDRWKADILAAFRHLKVVTRCAKITVIASRLGALLASHALKDTGLHRLIAWDPVASGSRYLGVLELTHQAMLAAEFNRYISVRDVAGTEQLVGFPFSNEARSQLQALAWTWPQRTTSIHIIASDDAGTAATQTDLTTTAAVPSGTQVSFHSCLDPMLWRDSKALRTQAFPQHFLRMVRQIMEGSGR